MVMIKRIMEMAGHAWSVENLRETEEPASGVAIPSPKPARLKAPAKKAKKKAKKR